MAEGVQTEAHSRLAGAVSRCLAAVFPDPYTFVIRFRQRAGRTEVVFRFARGGEEVEAGAVGGGVVDVASFALRVATLVMRRPAGRRLLVLDEAFRMVSKGRRAAVRKLLETTAAELAVQIVQTTHDPELAIGRVVRIGE